LLQSCGEATVKSDRSTCKYCNSEAWTTQPKVDAVDSEQRAKASEDVDCPATVAPPVPPPLSQAELDAKAEAELDALLAAELGVDNLDSFDGKLNYEEAEKNFRSFDVDNDGRVDVSELQRAYAKFGVDLSDAEVEKMIRDADIDYDGTLSFQEYLQMNGVTEEHHSMTLDATWLF